MITDGGSKVLLIENLPDRPDDDENEEIFENIGEEFADDKNDTIKLATKEMELKAMNKANKNKDVKVDKNDFEDIKMKLLMIKLNKVCTKYEDC